MAGRVAGRAVGLEAGALGRVIGVLGLTLEVVGLDVDGNLSEGLVDGRLILLLEFIGRGVGLVAGRVAGRFVAGLTAGEAGFLYVLPS